MPDAWELLITPTNRSWGWNMNDIEFLEHMRAKKRWSKEEVHELEKLEFNWFPEFVALDAMLLLKSRGYVK